MKGLLTPAVGLLAAASVAPPSDVFAPSVLGEKPAGFASSEPFSPPSDDGVTPITGVVDAELVSDEAGSGMGDEAAKKVRSS